MSMNDIKNMPIQERMQLMEVLLDSFSNDDMDMPSPAWHEDILNCQVSPRYTIPKAIS